MYAGIDLGASALKITLCDRAGRVRAESRVRLQTLHPAPDQAEQRPGDWLRALRRAFAVLDARNLSGLAVSAGTHSFVLLDARGRPLGNALLWSDQRAASVAACLEKESGQAIIDTGKNRIQATWTLAMLAWMREHRPQLLRQTARLCFAKDYLREWLSDATGPLTDPGDATGSLLADPVKQEWSEALCRLAGITQRQLPGIAQSDSPAGKLSRKAARALGLSPGLPIYTGCIDTSAELLPAGLLREDDCQLKLASAGVFSRIIDQAAFHPAASLYPTLNGGWYHASGVNNCAGAINWGTRALWNRNAPLLLDAAIGRVLARGVEIDLPLFHPYLLGERAPLWRADLRASFSGIHAAHGRDELAWAIGEGVLHALAHARDACELSQPGQAIAVTGGLTNLPNFMRLAAALLNQTLTTLAHSDASYGAALLAARAGDALQWSEIKAIATRNRVASHQPDAALVELLAQRYRNYRSQLPQPMH